MVTLPSHDFDIAAGGTPASGGRFGGRLQVERGYRLSAARSAIMRTVSSATAPRELNDVTSTVIGRSARQAR